MDVLNIQNFLKELSQNNNREWFAAHKEWYDKCKADFDEISRLLIMEIAGFNSECFQFFGIGCRHTAYFIK